jgi:hypothetical protein
MMEILLKILELFGGVILLFSIGILIGYILKYEEFVKKMK